MDYKLHNMQIEVNGHFACHAMEAFCVTCKSGAVEINLRKLRDRLGLTLEDMAERAPYSVSQLSRWEAGTSNIPSGNLPDLAKAYACRVQDIFTSDGDAPLLVPSEETLAEVLRGVQQERPDGLPENAWPRFAAEALRKRLELIAGGHANAASLGQRRRRAREAGAQPPLPTKQVGRA